MALDIIAVMVALRDRLRTIDGLRAHEYEPDQINPPVAFPLVPAISSYRETMRRGTLVVPMQIAVLVGAQVDRVGQRRLAEFANPVGDRSIRAALEDGDKTLGGLIHDLVVDSFEPRGLEEVGLINYYGGLFSVRVIASGA
jgi:hypothetical protein